MSAEQNRHVVEELWRRCEAADFAVGDLLHDDFVCDWPLSRERIRGRESFIAVNAHYPGRWRIRVQRILSEEDTVVTVAALTNAENVAETALAISFFELHDGRIARLTEYWPEPELYEAPAWRAQWVERIGG